MTIDETIAVIEVHVLKRRSGCVLHVSTPEALRSLCSAWIEAQWWLERGHPLVEVSTVMSQLAPRAA